MSFRPSAARRCVREGSINSISSLSAGTRISTIPASARRLSPACLRAGATASVSSRSRIGTAWNRFERDPALRVAILTGAGEKAFCAGGDLKEMVETGMQVPPRDMFPLPYDNVELSKPTIAAVNGVAFAGGWMIAQALS